MVVQGENVPHISKVSGDKAVPKTASNVFQIQKQQQAINCQYKNSNQSPESESLFRTTTPSGKPAPMTATKQTGSVQVHALPVQNTSQSGPAAPCAPVHKPSKQVLKP